MKIAYLFTTFPVLSETFLQREISVIAKRKALHEIHSLWGGESEWRGTPIKRFRLYDLLKLFYYLPKWCVKRPDALHDILTRIYQHDIHYLQNLWELLLGLGYGVVMADHFKRQKLDVIHGVWATMPATAAWTINKLTGIPFTMGAHAYDVYQNGGDCILAAKLARASLIHTTTLSTRQRLIMLGAPPNKISVIRRGLDVFPKQKETRSSMPTIHLISVGRLVEKKGYETQLKIYRALKDDKISFCAHIIGAGKLEGKLLDLRDELQLQNEVKFIGKLDNTAVMNQYKWADALLFTGRIADNGDRDGLPNVIPEAMAVGIPVMTTPVSGTTEAIEHNINGFVMNSHNIARWVKTIKAIQKSPQATLGICENARQWVEQNYDNKVNARTLIDAIQNAIPQEPCPIDQKTIAQSVKSSTSPVSAL